MKIGAVGNDRSHFPVFSERINTLAENATAGCRVMHFWRDWKHDWPVPEELENCERTTLDNSIRWSGYSLR